MLFGRSLLPPNPSTTDLSYPNPNPIIKPTKLQNIINHFWDRWYKEYLVNLREHHKINTYKKNRPTVQLNDVVIIGDPNRPRSSWRFAKVENLIESNTKQIRRAIVRVSKTNKLFPRHVNKLYLVEQCSCEDTDVNTNKPPTEVEVKGELKQKYSPYS